MNIQRADHITYEDGSGIILPLPYNGNEDLYYDDCADVVEGQFIETPEHGILIGDMVTVDHPYLGEVTVPVVGSMEWGLVVSLWDTDWFEHVSNPDFDLIDVCSPEVVSAVNGEPYPFEDLEDLDDCDEPTITVQELYDAIAEAEAQLREDAAPFGPLIQQLAVKADRDAFGKLLDRLGLAALHADDPVGDPFGGLEVEEDDEDDEEDPFFDLPSF